MRNYRVCANTLRLFLGACLELAVLIAAVPPADAYQYPGTLGQGPGFSTGGNQAVLGQGDRVPKLEAGFTKPGTDGAAQLFIVATMPEGAHTYSITQPAGGPIRTKIKVDTTTEVPGIGKFQAATPPDTKHDELAFPGIALEEQAGKVKWFAPIQLAAGAKPEAVKIEGKVNMQLCDAMGCVMPKDYAFAAKYRPDVPPEKERSAATPKATTTKAATPPVAPDVRTSGSSQNAEIVPPQGGTTNVAAPVGENANPQMTASDGEIQWLPFIDAADLRQIVSPDPEKFDIEQLRENIRAQDSAESMWTVMFWGFVGGLVLNIMPCVLPVIGLKILSFVQQSGHNRGRAFMLNVSYSLGLLSVFLLLALLAVVFHLGWGELFGRTWFKISLAVVVFAAALMFMGVWEIPLPTFLGGGKTGKLAAQEGVVGAFFKGVLTTFLATPCSAPLLAPAVAWATSQPAVVTFTVFLSAALGMASPYLLIGAFPELVRFLPKPGEWMETFKQFMGFVLMGTVIYLLAVLKPQYVVPTTGLLFGIAFTCWLVGRVRPEQEFGAKFRTWALGAAVVGISWIVMFPGLDERVLGRFHFRGLAAIMTPKDSLASTSSTNLKTSRIIGPKTVLVDFTASWCQNCHYYEHAVLNSTAVIDSLRQLGIVALKADWSDDDPKVTEMLDILGSRQVPVVAVFSPRDPNNPTILRGSYTQQDILDAFKKAGPSPQPKVAAL